MKPGSFLWKSFVLLLVCALVACGCGKAKETQEQTKPSGQQAEESKGGGVLYVGVMVHLEGWENEAQNRERFNAHANLVREYAAIFEGNGAKLTLEASPEFAEGCLNWGDNVLKEMLDRGHGVGVHADVGGEPGLTQQAFTSRIAEMKTKVESLGFTVRHVSGISSPLDWVTAAKDAGYKFVTGVVEYALKSIPEAKLPQEYRHVRAIRNPGEGHRSVPYQVKDRIHPWRMESGSNWLWDNPDGEVVLVPGDSGTEIKSMSGPATGRKSGPRQKASLTDEDINAFVKELEECLSYVDPNKVNVFYVAWSIGQEVDSAMVEKWVKAVQPYVDSGKVQWKTLPEAYDAYMVLESKSE